MSFRSRTEQHYSAYRLLYKNGIANDLDAEIEKLKAERDELSATCAQLNSENARLNNQIAGKG